jgi:hypothetical protein
MFTGIAFLMPRSKVYNTISFVNELILSDQTPSLIGSDLDETAALLIGFCF